MTVLPEAPPPDAASRELSLGERTIAIFTRPARAWRGLETKAQWWFPFAIGLLLFVVTTLALYHRAIVPTQLAHMEEAVASGRMPAAQYDEFAARVDSPMGMAFGLIFGLPAVALTTFFIALVVWFAGGFVLGTKFSYRQALEVVCWSELIAIVEGIIFGALAWQAQSFTGVHLGLGVLVPTAETASKMSTFLTSFLDGIGPFRIWRLIVAILGVSALSGAPRRNVAWVLSVLYLALLALGGAVGAMFSGGS